MKNIINEEINKINYLFGYKRGIVISEQEVEKTNNLTPEELTVLGYLSNVMDEYRKVKPSSPEEMQSNINYNQKVVSLANQLINKRDGKSENIDPTLYNVFKNNVDELGSKGEIDVKSLEGKGESVKSMTYTSFGN
jgi:hypothetical protein